MVLTLEVFGEQAGNLGGASRKVFNSIGGTIGRLADNDWVFADPYVSGRHALIRFVQGKYFIEDTSTNGVFINSPENRLARDQSHQLKNGDVIFIDAYRIRVVLEQDVKAKKDDPFALLKKRDGKGVEPRDETQAMPARPQPKPQSQPEEDRTASLMMGRAAAAADEEDDDGGTQWMPLTDMSLQASSPPPRAKAPQENAPARDVKSHARPPVQEERRAPARSTPESEPDANLEALLAAAGIEGLAATPQAAQTLGEVLRVAVGGVMDALRARERMKDELRMRRTTFKALDNNPLKVSVNEDDALHNLFVKRNAAYLEPAEAFEEALCDVRDHQSALVSAMRIAFEAMLAQFDPDRLQDEFDRRAKIGSIIGVPAKLRYWDLYRDRYGEMLKEGDASFRKLYGEDFARAYEEQLERLRSQREK